MTLRSISANMKFIQWGAFTVSEVVCWVICSTNLAKR